MPCSYFNRFPVSTVPSDHFTHLGECHLCLDSELRGTSALARKGDGVELCRGRITAATMVSQPTQPCQGLGPQAHWTGCAVPGSHTLCHQQDLNGWVFQPFTAMWIYILFSGMHVSSPGNTTVQLWGYRKTLARCISPTLLLCPSKHSTVCRLFRYLSIWRGNLTVLYLQWYPWPWIYNYTFLRSWRTGHQPLVSALTARKRWHHLCFTSREMETK